MAAISFTRDGFRAGALGSAPLVPGIAMYATAFGVMPQAAGLSTLEAALLSGWVNAGGAQMAALQAWSNPVPVLAVVLMSFAMNTRYLLLGAALRPWFGALPAYQSYPSLLVMGDGNWTAAMREREEGRHDAAFILGSGLVLWFVWISGTIAGHLFGRVLGEPTRFGIDFMLAAFFAAMAVIFVRKKSAILPLAIGAAVAILVQRLTEGPWYILAGAAAGSLAGALRRADPA
jgi:predicted branched-subunit amino acid permease